MTDRKKTSPTSRWGTSRHNGVGATASEDATGATTDGTAPAKGKGRTKKPKKETPAQARRAKEARERQMRMGRRYGGNRMKWILFQAGLLVMVLLTVINFSLVNQKVSTKDVDQVVAASLKKSGEGFPRGQAVMWAGQVVRVWGTWDEKNAAGREVLMSPYLSQGMDPDAGWNKKGTQTVLYSSVNPEPTVLDQNHAQVQAVYQIQDGSWRCITIPVYAYQPSAYGTDTWAFALAGNPTPTSCVPRTGAPSLTAKTDSLQAGGRQPDTTLGGDLAKSFFPGFFAAYAASDTTSLNQYTVSGVSLVGLGGAMASTPQPVIGSAVIYTDGKEGVVNGTTYNAYVPVTWTVTGSTSTVTAAYIVPMVRSGDRWYAAGEPTPAAQSSEIQNGQPAAIPAPDDKVVAPMPTSNAPTPTTPPATQTPTTGNGG